jgi:hypothetical protein
MNIKKNIFITTNVSILFKIHDTLQDKYNTLQDKYNTLVVTFQNTNNDDVISNNDTISNDYVISNNDTISNDYVIKNDDIISNIINNIMNDIINNISDNNLNKFNELVDFEFIESKKPNSSCMLIKSNSKSIWTKFTNKFLYG